MVVFCRFIIVVRPYISIAKPCRPGGPTRSQAVRDRAETRVVFNALVLSKEISECLKPRGFCGFEKHSCQLFQNTPLVTHDCAVVHEFCLSWMIFHQASGFSAGFELRDALHVDVKFIPKKPARRRIRARFKRLVKKGCKQWKCGGYTPAEAGHPIHHAFEIREVSGPGIPFGMEGVDGNE